MTHMMFLSGVSGLGAFDADYIREQISARQKANVQAAVAETDARAKASGNNASRVGTTAGDEALKARIIAHMEAQREAARKKKTTMLLAGGAGVALIAFFALKG
jgi:hypothetical protein